MSMATLERRLTRTLPDARIEVTTLPDCDGLRLGLINADYQTGPLDPAVMRAVLHAPAYWAFCWGSGLALARHLLAGATGAGPRLRGRTVLDIGTGSGVAAIAAALAGAQRVIACDTDPDALLATARNAALNGVVVEVTDTLPLTADAQPLLVDVVLMADVLYDRVNLPLLQQAQRHADHILVADSRISTLPDPDYREIGRIPALTVPNLGEFDEFRIAHLFHWRRPGCGPYSELSSSIASAS